MFEYKKERDNCVKFVLVPSEKGSVIKGKNKIIIVIFINNSVRAQKEVIYYVGAYIRESMVCNFF